MIPSIPSSPLPGERRDRVPYRQWIREGHIEATQGEVVDYERSAVLQKQFL